MVVTLPTFLSLKSMRPWPRFLFPFSALDSTILPLKNSSPLFLLTIFQDVFLLCFSCIFFRSCIFFSPVHWRVLHSRFPTLPSQLSFCCTGLKINTDSNAFQVSVHLNMLCLTPTPRLAPSPCELTLDDLFSVFTPSMFQLFCFP